MNIEKANQIPIEEVLKKMNFKPSKTNGFDVWFISPFRDEKTPSFKVNTKINRWYDHGIQKGGNIIDFLQLNNNLSISETLKYLDNLTDGVIFSFQKQELSKSFNNEITNEIEIIKTIGVQHYALKDYLEKRKIHLIDNEPNLVEIHYQLKEKKYFAIGFKNKSQGFEIRSKYAKICIGKKDITLIENHSDTICVFEGFMDYLSYRNSIYQLERKNYDYLILNSVALINKCETILNNYNAIELYLDNDKPGEKYTSEILSVYKNAIDKRYLYLKYKDLNDWLINTSDE